MKKFLAILSFVAPIILMVYLMFIGFQASKSWAQREYIDDPALHVHEPMDKLLFMHQEIKKVLGKPDVFEAYWEIRGEYVNNPKVHMRRMKFFIDCSPDNFPDSKPIHAALSTIALGGQDGHMIKIYWIPPGTEEYMDWQEVSFIKEADIKEICSSD
jgi:hypothetical protein